MPWGLQEGGGVDDKEEVEAAKEKRKLLNKRDSRWIVVEGENEKEAKDG